MKHLSLFFAISLFSSGAFAQAISADKPADVNCVVQSTNGDTHIDSVQFGWAQLDFWSDEVIVNLPGHSEYIWVSAEKGATPGEIDFNEANTTNEFWGSLKPVSPSTYEGDLHIHRDLSAAYDVKLFCSGTGLVPKHHRTCPRC